IKSLSRHSRDIVSIATFPDGKRIATASANKTIRIWMFEDGAEMMKWQYTYALVLLDDGNQVVS
ncbi:hypothetical protein P692DRAFT_20670257, partial [Suillus brevipes Sb2]